MTLGIEALKELQVTIKEALGVAIMTLKGLNAMAGGRPAPGQIQMYRDAMNVIDICRTQLDDIESEIEFASEEDDDDK